MIKGCLKNNRNVSVAIVNIDMLVVSLTYLLFIFNAADNMKASIMGWKKAKILSV
jgi:hypothetical protein